MYTFNLALGDLVGPHADPGLSVVGETGRALVSTSLSVPTVPEGVALHLIREDSVESWAVGCADWRLCKITTDVLIRRILS